MQKHIKGVAREQESVEEKECTENNQAEVGVPHPPL